MAREHARIWLDINSDDDFTKLTFDAQGFYTRIILTDPTLNYCGVADWRPRRLTVRARDLTHTRITACAAELEANHYLLFDPNTEEVLIRSYIRRDELLRNPKMAATVIKAYAAVASPTLRAAIVTEIKRIHTEHPEYSSWTHKDTADGLSRILTRPTLTESEYTPHFSYTEPVQITNGQTVENTYPNPVTNTYPEPVRNGIPDTGPDNQSQSVPNPSTSTLHPSPAPLEGYVTGERHQPTTPDPNAPRPPDRCPKHTHHPTPPPCRACADARHTAETWDHTHHQATEAPRRARRADIANCPHCDNNGWIDDGDEVLTRCPNHNWTPDHA